MVEMPPQITRISLADPIDSMKTPETKKERGEGGWPEAESSSHCALPPEVALFSSQTLPEPVSDRENPPNRIVPRDVNDIEWPYKGTGRAGSDLQENEDCDAKLMRETSASAAEDDASDKLLRPPEMTKESWDTLAAA